MTAHEHIAKAQAYLGEIDRTFAKAWADGEAVETRLLVDTCRLHLQVAAALTADGEG